MIYAIVDADGCLWIVDGSTGTALHTWQSQHPVGGQAPFEQGSWPSPGFEWSSEGHVLRIVHAGCLATVKFGSLGSHLAVPQV